ncbi:MAG: SDR family oxidoreductase [Bdellovibrionales bacterium]|nr:SDR family oxidoreductase [Bdellovibrionales bacterium]
MRKVVITGATSGFGKLLVDAFLKNGDHVIATGRNINSRKELFETERLKYPKQFLEVDLDVTLKEQVKLAAETIGQKLGSIDILINNAGFGLFGALEDLQDNEIRNQMEVNFFGTVEVTRAFLPMLRISRGKIFNFSSVFGFMGFPLTSLYCASKYAVEGLTESLRSELAPHGVQVCLIEPGGYRTNFGKNLSWSQNNPASIYGLQMKNYRELHDKLSKKKPQEPSEVSEGVLLLSLRNKLPMRKVFGKDAKMSYIMKNFLPNGFYFLMMDTFLKKIFMRRAV